MIAVSQYKEKLLKNLYSLYQKQHLCDLTIKVKDGEVRVHSLILCASSDYFKTLILAENQSRILWLSDMTLNEIEIVLNFVYTGEINSDKTDPSTIDLLKKYDLIEKTFWLEKDGIIMNPFSPLKLKDQFVSYSGHLSQQKLAWSSVSDKNEKMLCNKNKSRQIVIKCVPHENPDKSNEQASRSGDEIPTTCPNPSHISVDKANSRTIKTNPSHICIGERKDETDERSMSRDIVQEAYMTAMDMDLTDTDGGTSADNRGQDGGSGDTRTGGGDRTGDIIDHLASRLTKPADLKTTDSDHEGVEMDCTCDSIQSSEDEIVTLAGGSVNSTVQESKELTDNLLGSDQGSSMEKKIVTDDKGKSVNGSDALMKVSECKEQSQKRGNTSEGKNISCPVMGVVSGLRSRNGKKSRKVYTENPSEESYELGTEPQTLKHCRAKRSKYIKKDCVDDETVICFGSPSDDEPDKVPSLIRVVKTMKKGRHIWYSCPECGRTFKSLKLVTGHRYSKHSVAFDPSQFQVFKCKDCEYETLEVHRLACHRVTSHSTTRPYVCEWCGKDFKLLGALTLHTNTHTKARKFQCPHCSKSFMQHGARKKHVEEKHQNSHRHLCDVCPFAAMDRVKLVQHKYSNHDTPLPPGYTICNQPSCKFETFRKQLFTGHINTHNGVQDYACDVCQKKFSSAGNMRSHRTIHKEKSLSCIYKDCDFTTRLNNRLTQHIRLMHTHRDMKPHMCPHCPYKTAIKGNLLKHQRNIHKANQNTSTNMESPQDKGHYSTLGKIRGDNSFMQIPLDNSTSVLKSLLYSSSSIQLVDLTTQHISDAQQVIVNAGTTPEIILDGVSQMVLGADQSH